VKSGKGASLAIATGGLTGAAVQQVPPISLDPAAVGRDVPRLEGPSRFRVAPRLALSLNSPWMVPRSCAILIGQHSGRAWFRREPFAVALDEVRGDHLNKLIQPDWLDEMMINPGFKCTSAIFDTIVSTHGNQQARFVSVRSRIRRATS
jgi:hypothetical protein